MLGALVVVVAALGVAVVGFDGCFASDLKVNENFILDLFFI